MDKKCVSFAVDDAQAISLKLLNNFIWWDSFWIDSHFVNSGVNFKIK